MERIESQIKEIVALDVIEEYYKNLNGLNGNFKKIFRELQFTLRAKINREVNQVQDDIIESLKRTNWSLTFEDNTENIIFTNTDDYEILIPRDVFTMYPFVNLDIKVESMFKDDNIFSVTLSDTTGLFEFLSNFEPEILYIDKRNPEIPKFFSDLIQKKVIESQFGVEIQYIDLW